MKRNLHRLRRYLTHHRRYIYGLIGASAMSVILLISTMLPREQNQALAIATASELTPESDASEAVDETTPDSELSTDASVDVAVPEVPATVPAADTDEPQQYVLEFNRSPVVGNRLRLTGIYDEARLRFTRPRDWQTTTVQVLLRYRHSGALYATRSNLTVLVNGTSIGSVPLNQPQGELGEVIFDVPLNLLQDYNEVVIAALQNNSPTCTQDALDPSLWTEIMPDSKVVFDYQPQPIQLDFSRYPYPIFDDLKLQTNQIAYLQPPTVEQSWLTNAARLQASLGRIAQFRALESRVVDRLDTVIDDERLIIIGTPSSQPNLTTLDLPIALNNSQFVDRNDNPIADDIGLLMMTSVQEGRIPVMVVTGNSPTGVAKAIQFLVQPGDRQIATGSAILVNTVTSVASPDPRDWPDYLPLSDTFTLKDLTTFNDQPYEDVTVRGSHSPALEFDFRALPDDRFLSGNVMTLRYSYGPQVNALTSLVEIQLDGVAVGGERLSSINGSKRETLRVELPANRIKPYSKIQVNFRLDPRERRSCSRPTDQQLWGTIHADSNFDLNRENVVRLPNLELLRTGYPFTAPQDMSNTTFVVPDRPSITEITTLLEFSERLGRLSDAQSIQFNVYVSSELPQEQRDNNHLVAIATQDRFPFEEAFETDGFRLRDLFTREWQDSDIQTLPDTEGLMKQIVSPWNPERVLLAISAQTNRGLEQVRDLIQYDPLFYQLHGDTVIVSLNENEPLPYEPDAYNLAFLEQAPQIQEIADPDWSSRLKRFIRSNWLVLGGGIVAAALVLYGVLQLYLKRVIPNYRQTP
jgi:hypothetical protein